MEKGNVSCSVFSKNTGQNVRVKSIVKDGNSYRFIFETVKIRLSGSSGHRK